MSHSRRYGHSSRSHLHKVQDFTGFRIAAFALVDRYCPNSPHEPVFTGKRNAQSIGDVKFFAHFEAERVCNIRREFVIGETGMYRKEIPEIPAEAIREAVANALCHRDYTTGTSVEVNVFMDAVQIVSPGLFPKGDSPEKHLEGVASEFRLRNPAIARTLFRAGVIEQYGTGIPRIKESCEAAGVRFRFEQTANSTIVVFERPGSQVDGPNGIATTGATGTAVGVSTFKSLDGAEKIAVQIARDSGRVTKKALMERTEVGKTKATETLKRLAEIGFLEWVGSSPHDPKQYYRTASKK